MEPLRQYHIVTTLNPLFYYNNYFIHALKQYGFRRSILEIVGCHLTDIYLTTKDICMLGGDIGLVFIVRQPRDRKSRSADCMLDK